MEILAMMFIAGFFLSDVRPIRSCRLFAHKASGVKLQSTWLFEYHSDVNNFKDG
jgi:hypothetical protein